MRKAVIRRQADGTNFTLIILFIASAFLVSSFKIAKVSSSAMVAMGMLAAFVMGGLLRGRFVLAAHPVQKGMLALLAWAFCSLLVSRVDPSKAVPPEAYAYSWAGGLSSPDLRGASFLARLFLAAFAMNFIIEAVNTERRYFKALNWFLLFYFSVSALVLAQFALLAVWGVEVGEIRPASVESAFRTGGHLGESSILAGVLASGYFLTIAFSVKGHPELWFPDWLVRGMCAAATMALLTTLSAAWIISALLAFALLGHRHLGKRGIIVLIVCMASAGALFHAEIYDSVMRKALGEVSQLNIRTYSWLAGLSIFMDHAYTGVGIGQSVFFTPEYLKEIAVRPFLNPDAFTELFLASRFPPLNTYIQWMAETGAVGLVLLFYLYYLIYRSGKGITDPEHERVVKFGMGGALIASAVAINTSPDYLYVGFLDFLAAMYAAGGRVFGRGRLERGA
ncbi:MAG: O-antigen ligase family protein [Thermodesulfobacteriota bacterium]|nr:MAG: O-antigen ligase family protein [Thermodesulfobacteriota bacterium]